MVRDHLQKFILETLHSAAQLLRKRNSCVCKMQTLGAAIGRLSRHQVLLFDRSDECCYIRTGDIQRLSEFGLKAARVCLDKQQDGCLSDADVKLGNALRQLAHRSRRCDFQFVSRVFPEWSIKSVCRGRGRFILLQRASLFQFWSGVRRTSSRSPSSTLSEKSLLSKKAIAHSNQEAYTT